MGTKLDDVKADIDRIRDFSKTLTIETLHQDVQLIAKAIERLCDVVERLIAEAGNNTSAGPKP